MLRWVSSACCLCVVAAALVADGWGADDRGIAPADRNANPATRRVLGRLAAVSHDLPTQTPFLIGQNIGHANLQIGAHYHRFVRSLETRTGSAPAMLAADYGYEQIGPGIASTNRLLIAHWRRGGLVTLSFHPRNPWKRSAVDDIEGVNLSLLLDGRSAVSIAWRGVLEKVADGLQQLQAEGVVVLWRPFHEMNGNWFWWGGQHPAKLTRDEYHRLWRHMFQFFTKERKLHNLLWVYAPSVNYGESTKPVNDYYPGAAYVDLVAADFYGDPFSDQLKQSLLALKQLGKPVALAEFGFRSAAKQRSNLQLVDALHALPFRPAYVVYWHGWKGNPMAIIENPDATALMQHADVIDLKDWLQGDKARRAR